MALRGPAYVRADGALVRGARVIDRGVHNQLAYLAASGAGRARRDEALAYTRLEGWDTEVWRVDGQGRPRRMSHDGRSDRPVFLPDGRLLWISGAGGRAHWVLEGVRLCPDGLPVPAYPERTRVEGEAVVFDAGEGPRRLSLKTCELLQTGRDLGFRPK